MELFGFALTLLDILLFGVFFIALVVGTSFDRQGRDGPKWIVLGAGALLFAGLYWSSWTIKGTWELVKSWEFWRPAMWYLVVGVAYAVFVEFALDVRRSARMYKESWKSFLDQSVYVRNVIELDEKRSGAPLSRGGSSEAKVKMREAFTSTDQRYVNYAKAALNEYITSSQRRDRIVGLEMKATDIAPVPKINKMELADCLTAWTVLWPPYAVSLVVGDLLTEIFQMFGELVVKLSGRFVRWVFKDVFQF